MLNVEYARTVLIVQPTSLGGHFGFILNRPLDATLGRLLPTEKLAVKADNPVYFGGPNGKKLYALIDARKVPKSSGTRITEELFMAALASDIDKTIEFEAARARSGKESAEPVRFVAGIVRWDTGQLDRELESRLWYVEKVDPKYIFRRDTEGLWEELILKRRAAVNTI